ncbi:hypothetical protein Tco_0404134 [Tanacetum coccineum]
MGWVVCSNAVVESCDAVLIFVVTASRCICDAVSSDYREILEQCWCRNYGRSIRQYSHHGTILSIVTRNQAPGVVKPEIGGNVNFKIKSQLMRELREDTFFGNKDEDAHDHIDWVLSIVGLFNIPEVSKDAVMLRVFPFTLTGAAKRWGPIPGMTPAQALTAIQTMADHSQKWHDETTSRNIGSSSSKDGLATLVNKLDNLGRDMRNLKESVHAIQVGCQICEGPHLDKDCPLNEEVKQVEEIDNRPPYGEKRQSLEELLAKHQEEFAREVLKWRCGSRSFKRMLRLMLGTKAPCSKI